MGCRVVVTVVVAPAASPQAVTVLYTWVLQPVAAASLFAFLPFDSASVIPNC